MTESERNDWETTTLSCLGEFRNGVNYSRKDEGDGLKLIKTEHIFTDGPLLNLDSLPMVNLEDKPGIENYFVEAGDIFFVRSYGRRDGVGFVSMAPSDDPRTVHGGFIIRFRVTSAKADSLYLTYLLRSPHYRDVITTSSGGSAINNVNQETLGSLAIKSPPFDTQRKIAGALFLYDSLIENNSRRTRLLEEMARAIYREWFVRFRFPGNEEVEMVDSELGVIPDGWTVSTLGKECKLIIGQSPKSQFYNEDGNGLPFHQGVKDFGSVIPNHRVYCAVDKRVAELGDILFSVRAPVGRINLADTKLIVGRGLHAIRHNYDKQAFLLYQLRNRFFKEDLIGSGTVFQAVTKSDMLGIELHIPPAHLVDEFELKVEPMVQLMVNLVKQNQILIQIRDLLLPHLVSGEIDVSEMDIAAPTSNAHTTSKYSD